MSNDRPIAQVSNHGISLLDLADWKPMLIDLGTSVTVAKDLSAPIYKGDQLWLTGIYADTLSTPFIKVEISDSSGTICQETIVDTSLAGGAAFHFTMPGTATPVFREYSVPQPLLLPSRNIQRITRLNFKVTSQAGAAVTYNKLQLFFAVSQLATIQPNTSPNVNAHTVLARDGYNQF